MVEKRANGQNDAAEKPKRRRGRPRGYAKTGGRQKRVQNWSSQEVRERLMPVATEKVEAIIRGDRILTSGSTGKDIRRRPSLQDQLKAAELAYRKCLADLQATQLTGANEEPLFTNPPDVRDTARAIVSILSQARLANEAEGGSQPPAPPGQQLLTRAPIIEVNPQQDSDAPASAPAQALDGEVPGTPSVSGASSVGNGSEGMGVEHPPGAEAGDGAAASPAPAADLRTMKFPHNGSQITWNASEQLWYVLGWDGRMTCRLPDKEKAIERAIGLNGSDGKQHPYEGEVVFVEPPSRPSGPAMEVRRDNMPFAEQRSPRVPRRTPK